MICNLCFLLGLVISCSTRETAPNFLISLYYNSNDNFDTKQISLDQFRGKAVVINFWAPMCPPCRAEMPLFEEYWQQVKGKGVIVLGADVGHALGLGDQAQARDFIKQIGVTYPTGKTNSSSVVDSYKIIGMPTTVFISPDGNLEHTWIGSIGEEDLFELTKKYIK